MSKLDRIRQMLDSDVTFYKKNDLLCSDCKCFGTRESVIFQISTEPNMLYRQCYSIVSFALFVWFLKVTLAVADKSKAR